MKKYFIWHGKVIWVQFEQQYTIRNGKKHIGFRIIYRIDQVEIRIIYGEYVRYKPSNGKWMFPSRLPIDWYTRIPSLFSEEDMHIILRYATEA